MDESVRRVEVRRVGVAVGGAFQDTIVVEEPLEVRIGPSSIVVTMRTPGNDEELAAGFLFTEGVIASVADIADIEHCVDARSAEERGNVIVVTLAASAKVDLEQFRRHFFAASSCGVCGKASMEQVRRRVPGLVRRPLPGDEIIRGLPEKMRASQRLFERTGGLHAATVFDAVGNLLCLREDVGRHNAVDKAIGWALLDGRLPLADTILMVSGRASFEIVQKALAAGIPTLCSVSAVSTLAVDMAREGGMNLLGFLRGASWVVYS